MLLMIEALLLISAILPDHIAAVADGEIFLFDIDLDFMDHIASVADGEIFPLDMALDSVDDLYVGCKERMECLVKTYFLEDELNNSPNFRTVWEDALRKHKTPEDELKKLHSVALYVYTNSRYNLYQEFNNAVRSKKKEYRIMTYRWYSLQFFLTEAIQILKETQTGCKSTYRRTDIDFNTNVLHNHVRFGSFTSSSLNMTAAEIFGNKSCFEITTCEGADVTAYSTFPDEREVLIPPYEVFEVKEIKKNLWCETVFVLESIGVKSDLNCDMFRRSAESVTDRSRFRMHELRRRRFYSRYRDGRKWKNRRIFQDPLTLALRICTSV